MLQNNIFYYGDIDKNGYHISYLLLNYNIEHSFIFMPEKNIVVVNNLKEIEGYDKIVHWIVSYEFIFDIRR